MIEFTYNVVDLAATERDGKPVVDVVRKKPGDVWLVPAGPILMDGPLNLREHTRGELVPIPLVPYLTQRDPVLAMAFMLQLGLRCAHELPGHARRIHVAVGTPLNVVRDGFDEQDRLQCYLGFGVVVQR